MGCTKVSPACTNCYAERDMDHRYGKVQWGPNGTRVKTSEANWKMPIRWNKEAARSGVRRRVFCASLADVFEDWSGPIFDHNGNLLINCPACGIEPYKANEPPLPEGCEDRWLTLDDVRRDLFTLFPRLRNLDLLVLTKRPENIIPMIEKTVGLQWWRDNCPNVWLGTSVENQKHADKRIPELLKCRDLAPVLFLSMEPLLGPVDLVHTPVRVGGEFLGSNLTGLDWIIAGGESGPHARPSHPDWFRSIRDQCQAAGVPYFFKQWGEWAPEGSPHSDRHGRIFHDGSFFAMDKLPTGVGRHAPPDGIAALYRVGKKAAGRLLDGREWNELPAVGALK